MAAAETTSGDSAAPPAAGPAAEALSDPPEAAAAPGGGPAFSFAAPGSSSRLQLRVGIPGEDEAQPATPSFALASPAAQPAAAPGQAPAGGAPASPAGSAAASCSGEGGLQTPRDASQPPAASPSQAGTPPAQRCPSPATPGAAAPALLSPGPLVRPLGPADIDNAYSSVATPEKGPEAGPDVVGEELPPTLIEVIAAEEAAKNVACRSRPGMCANVCVGACARACTCMCLDGWGEGGGGTNLYTCACTQLPLPTCRPLCVRNAWWGSCGGERTSTQWGCAARARCGARRCLPRPPAHQAWLPGLARSEQPGVACAARAHAVLGPPASNKHLASNRHLARCPSYLCNRHY